MIAASLPQLVIVIRSNCHMAVKAVKGLSFKSWCITWMENRKMRHQL